MPFLALDFDGVLCDSADETGATGWAAASELWPDHCRGVATPSYLATFRRLRPVVETGFESLLVARLWADGTPEAVLLTRFQALAAQLCRAEKLERPALVARFGTCRDRRLATDRAGWLGCHRAYPGVVAAVQAWAARGLPLAIITTKEQRFVDALADHLGLAVPTADRYALEAGPKLGVLRRLRAAHPSGPHWFVEDRLATLLALAAEPDLADLGLALADWGYLTPTDLARAAGTPRLRRLSLAEFPGLV